MTLSITYGVLDEVGETIIMPISGMVNVAIKVAGSFDGTVEFEASRSSNSYQSVSMLEWGTQRTATNATVLGNWWFRNADYQFFRARRTELRVGAGRPYVVIGAANDGSFADVFQQTSDRFKTSTGTANTANSLSLAAVEHKAHRLTKLVVSYSGGTPTTANVAVGNGENAFWDVSLPLESTCTDVPLPSEGIIGNPNNPLSVTVAAGGSGIVSRISAEFRSA